MVLKRATPIVTRATFYNGHFRGPLTLIPVRPGFEHTTFRMRGITGNFICYCSYSMTKMMLLLCLHNKTLITMRKHRKMNFAIKYVTNIQYRTFIPTHVYNIKNTKFIVKISVTRYTIQFEMFSKRK